MPLPSVLLRQNKNNHKGDFGHVLIIAGSSSMLGAAALTGLSAMRSGAGLTTIGIPKGLNSTLQKKISPVIMTLPLAETPQGTLALKTFKTIMSQIHRFNVLAIGPGLSTHPKTKKLILKLISACPIPLIIDGDALNALSDNVSILNKISVPKILTPHAGEMARLTGLKKTTIEKNRISIAKEFSQSFGSIVVLKGHQTIIADPDGKTFINPTGNVGLATAGSGDVLTGIIAAFLAQGIEPLEAARWGVYIHGKAGDLAAKNHSKTGMIATDIIERIPQALKHKS